MLNPYVLPEYKSKTIRLTVQTLRDAEDLAALCNRKSASLIADIVEKEVARMMEQLKTEGGFGHAEKM